MSLLQIPPDDLVETYTNILTVNGEDGAFRKFVGMGVKRSIQISSPEVEMLDLSESFFALYRRTGEENYFKLGKVLRRAAHKLYRGFVRGKRINKRFLSVVQE